MDKLVLRERGDKEGARVVEAMHNGVGKGWYKPIFENQLGAHKLCFIHYAELPPGSSCGLHRHSPGCEELWYVVEGKGLVKTDTEEYEMKPHDVHLVKDGGFHGIKNIGDRELKWLCINLIRKDE